MGEKEIFTEKTELITESVAGVDGCDCGYNGNVPDVKSRFVREYTIDGKYEGKAVKEYLKSELLLSRRIITGLKTSESGIMLNGKRVTVRALMRSGDILALELYDSKESENIVPVKSDIEILYEDDDIIAVSKPYNMPTHPSHNHYTDSLANGLSYYFASRGIPFVFRAVNRLDRDTSGVVLVAKNQMAAQRLSGELINGEIHKRYTAIVLGKTEESGVINAPIRRREESIIERIVCKEGDGGQSAVTEYETAASDNELSIVSVRPRTGRTHQIRVHMAYIGHPILGDTLYGDNFGSERIGRQALHCSAMTFTHPVSGKTMTVYAKLPHDMQKIADEITIGGEGKV